MYDVIVIGSGPGGYVAAIRAAQLGLKTAIIERYRALGGTCLNVGCIPSKTLLHATHLLKSVQSGACWGVVAKEVSYDWGAMVKKKKSIVQSFNGGIAFLMKKNRIDILEGTATFQNEKTIQVNEKSYTSKHFIIATGSKPIPLPFLPFDEQKVYSSTGMLSLSSPPQTLLIVGAGVIGIELGSVFNRLGTKVEFIEFFEGICPALDREIANHFQKELESQGLKFHLKTKVSSADLSQNVLLKTDKGEFSADAVLVAVGRFPYTHQLGLETIGVQLDSKGFVAINERFQTSQPHIYAIGDVSGAPFLAHKASEEGIAVAELIAGKAPLIEYIAIPSVIYTSPEVASVGLSEEAIKEKNIPYRASSFPFKANSRARCIGREQGIVKLLSLESGHLIGAHIMAEGAGELIAECALAIKNRLKLKDIAETSHAHPTLSESIKEAALLKAIHI